METCATLDPPSKSVPIDLLVRIPGTLLSELPVLEPIEFVRTVESRTFAFPEVSFAFQPLPRNAGSSSGTVLLLRRQFYFLWRQAAHFAESWRRQQS